MRDHRPSGRSLGGALALILRADRPGGDRAARQAAGAAGPITTMGQLARLAPGQARRPLPPIRPRRGPRRPGPGAGRCWRRARRWPGRCRRARGSSGRARRSARPTLTAINRFFGLPIIRGRVYQGASWLDGRPSLILDYQGTSRLYDHYRDEIRQVGPDLYLGLMFDRTTAPPPTAMYFAFQPRP